MSHRLLGFCWSATVAVEPTQVALTALLGPLFQGTYQVPSLLLAFRRTHRQIVPQVAHMPMAAARQAPADMQAMG